MKIIIGLGNPGKEYENTRHNIGFMSVFEFAEQHGIAGNFDKKFNSIIGKGSVSSQDVLIVQPLTFMNLSGEALRRILDWYKVSSDDILVVFDDISIDLGKMRFRKKGSDGGHNGIKSIIKNLGTQDFLRLKIGIGPQPPMIPSEKYVLGKFTEDESLLLKKILTYSSKAIEEYIINDIDFVMNKYNGVVVD